MLVTGFFGGFGFAMATFLKLVEVKYVPMTLSYLFGESAWQTNWHSILEQTYGFLNGVGVGVAMACLARRVPPCSDEPRLRRWTEVAAVAFVLLLITFVNVIQNVPNWIRAAAIPARLYDLPSRLWFGTGYAVLALVVILLLFRHLRQRLALIPESRLGKAQLLYLVFLWWVVIGNLMRAIPPFQEQRLITEGVIHLVAVLCTLFALLWPGLLRLPDMAAASITGRMILTITCLGLIATAATVAFASWGTRAIHGGAFVGHAGYHT
ncbi:MAG: hypothetical protein E6K70_26470, partial [Planctomycetota bacterium]